MSITGSVMVTLWALLHVGSARAAAARTGLRDGWEQPFELTMGMSYPTDVLDDAYGHGCNTGQWIGQHIHRT